MKKINPYKAAQIIGEATICVVCTALSLVCAYGAAYGGQQIGAAIVTKTKL